MKTTLSIITIGIALLTIITGDQLFENHKKALNEHSALNYESNKGVYLASEFLQFKKENMYKNLLKGNMNAELYASQTVSDKVLFKMFVKYKTGKLAE